MPISKRYYEEAAQKAELWSGLLSALMIKILPFCACTLLSLTIFLLYFVYDWGEDAFMLPTPMW